MRLRFRDMDRPAETFISTLRSDDLSLRIIARSPGDLESGNAAERDIYIDN